MFFNFYFTFFQDPCNQIMKQLIFFHDTIMFILIWILFFVLYLLIYTFKFTQLNSKEMISRHLNYAVPYSWNILGNSILEIIWTIIPIFILIIIAIPSFSILYYMDDSYKKIDMVIHVEGNQWYWVYTPIVSFSEYSYDTEEYESYPEYVTEEEMFEDLLRDNFSKNFNKLSNYPLSVDDPLLVPCNSNLKFLISSEDVLHSWSVPSLGIKMDACPGRINQIFSNIEKPGVYYGQCSELCGLGHSLMPIEIHALMI